MHTVDTKEIENFARDSARWWDENGPFAPLHRLNPVRLSYIKDQICTRYGGDTQNLKPFKGLSLLDIGCGGGLVCEPMARLGAAVTGIDADQNAIAAAMAHAKDGYLSIDYKAIATDDLKKSGKTFDIVLALEIVEHVADVQAFVQDCLDLCKPGGLVIFSTLNRTAKSFILGKFAAEYILRWVPVGTHTWKKFLKPSELAAAVRDAGGTVTGIDGLSFNPVKGAFERSPHDTAVNYFLAVAKA